MVYMAWPWMSRVPPNCIKAVLSSQPFSKENARVLTVYLAVDVTRHLRVFSGLGHLLSFIMVVFTVLFLSRNLEFLKLYL